MAIIGIDFGNVNSFPAFVKDMNEKTRTGGTELSLLPADPYYVTGIPTTFHYSAHRGESYGKAAMTANPKANRRNLLKTRFDTTEVIDGKEISYDAVITKMIEHIVHLANDTLQKNYMTSTNEIALSYPVHFTRAQVMHLVRLAEAARLPDGTPVKVAGTIREPAAAALAYLGSIKPPRDEYNVLVYDLGGGTFDVASVTTHLKGSKANGALEYYDLVDMDGLKDVGGSKFDEAMFELFKKKTGKAPTKARTADWMLAAERAKMDLTEQPVVYPEVTDEYGEIFPDLVITREEYEAEVLSLVQRTVACTVNLAHKPNVPKPDMILLTGGQSQMPLIMRMLREAFPGYDDKSIIIYKPQQAIAYGAARYGVLECEQEKPAVKPGPKAPVEPPKPVLHQRTRFDIGVGDIFDRSGRKHVDVLIPAGTELPTKQSHWISYSLAEPRRTDLTPVMEAVRTNPDLYAPEDFNGRIDLILDFGEVKPAGYKVELCLYIDQMGQLQAIVRDAQNHAVNATLTYALQDLQ